MKLASLLICLANVLAVTCVLPAQDNSQSTSEQVCEIRRVGDCGVAVAPKPVYHPDPEYTDHARRKKINGSVVVSFIVTKEGKVRNSEIKQGLDKGLDQQALAAVNTWRFEPALKEGKPVEVRLRAEITFRVR